MSKLKIHLSGVSAFVLTATAFGHHACAVVLPLGATNSATDSAGFDPGLFSPTADLPDSPDYVRALNAASAAPSQATAQTGTSPAPRDHLTIHPGEVALPLSSGAKMGFAFRSIASPGGFALNVASAGISHATDSRPHFGTDSAGFGERVGSTVYRSSVKSLFGYGILPSLFHDDPRYYVLGAAAPFKKRLVYAGTRIVVTRKDSGARGVNWPQLLAPVVSQGSANGFYPARDQDITKTVTGILVSYATSAGVYAGKEFSAEIRRKLHLKQ